MPILLPNGEIIEPIIIPAFKTLPPSLKAIEEDVTEISDEDEIVDIEEISSDSSVDVEENFEIQALTAHDLNRNSDLDDSIESCSSIDSDDVSIANFPIEIKHEKTPECHWETERKVFKKEEVEFKFNEPVENESKHSSNFPSSSAHQFRQRKKGTSSCHEPDSKNCPSSNTEIRIYGRKSRPKHLRKNVCFNGETEKCGHHSTSKNCKTNSKCCAILQVASDKVRRTLHCSEEQLGNFENRDFNHSPTDVGISVKCENIDELSWFADNKSYVIIDSDENLFDSTDTAENQCESLNNENNGGLSESLYAGRLRKRRKTTAQGEHPYIFYNSKSPWPCQNINLIKKKVKRPSKSKNGVSKKILINEKEADCNPKHVDSDKILKNEKEADRRSQLRELFLNLKNEMPHLDTIKKVSKSLILNEAIIFIKLLEKEYTELNDDVKILENHQANLSKTLNVLEETKYS